MDLSFVFHEGPVFTKKKWKSCPINANAIRLKRWRLVYQKTTLCCTLAPNEVKDLRSEVMPLRRGRIQLAGISVARPDPLGLCYARQFKRLPQSIPVLPKRYSLPSIQLPGGRKHHSGGIAVTTSVGESEEFVSVRDYRPGDPLRKFHC